MIALSTSVRNLSLAFIYELKIVSAEYCIHRYCHQPSKEDINAMNRTCLSSVLLGSSVRVLNGYCDCAAVNFWRAGLAEKQASIMTIQRYLINALSGLAKRSLPRLSTAG